MRKLKSILLHPIKIKDNFSTRAVICPFKGLVDYKPGEISCGMLEVPENREKARPRRIELHYVKIAAKKPDDWNAEENGEWGKRDDPIIYLTGGPGAQVQGYVERLKDHGVREARDLYILEQRGIGWSGDFCPLYPFFDPAAANTPDWDQYQRAGLEAMDACFAAAKAARSFFVRIGAKSITTIPPNERKRKCRNAV